MFRRSTSRAHPRLFRFSTSSPQNHLLKDRVFAYIGALLLLSTVAFLYAKGGSRPRAAQHDVSDYVAFNGRSVTVLPRGGTQERDFLGSEPLRKGYIANVNEDDVKSINKEADIFDSKASEQPDERKAGTDSFVLPQDDYNNDDDVEKNQEIDLGLETDEMEDLENPRDTAAEGLDDMDEDDGSKEEEANEQVTEVGELERKDLSKQEAEIDGELEKGSDNGKRDSETLLAGVTRSVDAPQTHDTQANSSTDFPGQKAENKRYEGEAATEHTSNKAFQGGSHATFFLRRLGGGRGIPNWDPLEGLGNVGLDNSARDARRSFDQGFEMKVSSGNDGIIWDHLLGVARRLGTENINKHPAGARKFKFGADEINVLESVKERDGGLSNGSFPSSTQVFSSDDEPLDEDIRERLEKVAAIEDALLLKTGKGDANEGRLGKAPFDALNPTNNPLLQDPDTSGPTNLTKSDEAMWKAIRKASVEETTFLQHKSGAADSESTMRKENVVLSENHEGLPGQLVSGANGAERSILEILSEARNLNSLFLGNLKTKKTDLQQKSKVVTPVDPRTSVELKEDLNPHLLLPQEKGEETLPIILSNTPVKKSYSREEADLATPKPRNNKESEEAVMDTSDRHMGDVDQLEHVDSESTTAGEVVMQGEAGSTQIEPFHKKNQISGDSRKWGFFPGIDPFLSFSEFLEQFLLDSRCSLRVFMAWTTSPWTYTVRYQRGLESLLHFHSQACVVVFSESIELSFFESFVEDGYRVAVVLPNLEELLKGTPADVFASVWLSWRKIDLFHIHYTELLRLAALYKYGGIYLDTDVIILKPLNLLHNTIGAEMMENHMQRMNGAVMAFDRLSPFLLKCLAEFTATYDDRLLEFNGAELLTRVVNSTAGEQKKKWEELSGELNIKFPYAFFPLSSGNITRYFVLPVNQQEVLEHDQILKMIFNQSLTLHFWNQRTSRLVPEVGSLVEKVINHHCMRCNEYL